MLNRIHVLGISLGTALITAGCAGLIPGTVKPGQSAENPLNGAPLNSSIKAEGIPFEGERACTTWPIEDNVQVTATENEICVEGAVHKLVQPEFPPTEALTLRIESDGGGNNGMGGGSTKSNGARAQKIGSCFDKTANKSKVVWVANYKGCVPNRDDDGKPVLSKTSTYLEVGVARWNFPPPVPTTEKPPTTTVSSAPAPAAAPVAAPPPPPVEDTKVDPPKPAAKPAAKKKAPAKP